MDRLEIVNEKWDYLVVLDACRYDYFSEVYEKYIQGGRLLKKRSIGSCTNEWRDESFPGYYDDIVYISANPQISLKTSVYGYTAGEHFHNVYELWKEDWDASRGTVLPDKVTERAIEITGNTSDKRIIIHYLQPHAPYIGSSLAPKGYEKADIAVERTLIGIEKTKPSAFKSKLYEYLLKIFTNNTLLTNRPDWVLRKLLGIPPVAPMEIAMRTLGKKKLRQAYKANLELVLEQVAVLIKNLSGRIVVTSDHGELLGEHRCYSHPKGWTEPILVDVPWLVIEKPVEASSEACEKSQHQPSSQTNKQQEALDQQQEDEMVIERLRSLGYYE